MNVIAGAFVLLLACIGNAELWVILINRRHSLRYPHHVLRRIRHIHDAGMLLFPPFIIATAGFRENGLLRGGTFADLPFTLQLIIVIVMCGLIPLCFSVLRWQMSHRPNCLRESESTIIDVLALAEAADDKERQHLVLGDTTKLLSRLPGNQIYQLEVNRKTIDLPQRAGKSGGFASSTDEVVIRLAHFSDVHLIGCPGRGYHEFVAQQLCDFRPDAFVFTGDLIDQPELLPWAEDAFASMAAVAPGLFILGNHDWHLDHASIRNRLKATGWTDFGAQSSVLQLAGANVRVAGTEAPWMGRNPDVPNRSDEALRILLSHSPDQRDYATNNNFDLMLCGHNHGGQVRLPVIGPVYSPSKYGVQYAGGVYEHHGMVIHVSRGVGGMDPIRWNCRPEITLLELRLPANDSQQMEG